MKENPFLPGDIVQIKKYISAVRQVVGVRGSHCYVQNELIPPPPYVPLKVLHCLHYSELRMA